MAEMPTIDPALAPEYALAVLRALESAGYEAWFVGGWVRDALRGVPAHDVDVCTDAAWEQTEAALGAAGIEAHETGIAHGTVTAVVDHEPVEVTTYRIDGTYSDQRHPDQVTFVTDVREDLARRDFTVNAMAWHPVRGLLDPFGGQDDLERGLIRAVGEPALRFSEDALRVLRAVRFACRLGFEIEPATQAALREAAPTLAGVANERIGSELRGILASGHAAWALREQREVMVAAIPELAPTVGFEQRSPYHAYDVYEHIARVVEGVEFYSGGLATERLRWAALLHDVGKPRCFTVDEKGQGHFYGHPHEGAVMADEILRRLAIPRELARPVVALVRLHDRPTTCRRKPYLKLIAELDRRAGSRTRTETVVLMHEMLHLRRADAIAKAPEYREWAVELDAYDRALREIDASGVCWRASDLAISGGDVIAVKGIEPGPKVGEVLSQTLAAVMAGQVPNEREALLARLRGRDGRSQEAGE